MMTNNNCQINKPIFHLVFKEFKLQKLTKQCLSNKTLRQYFKYKINILIMMILSHKLRSDTNYLFNFCWLVNLANFREIVSN